MFGIQYRHHLIRKIIKYVCVFAISYATLNAYVKNFSQEELNAKENIENLPEEANLTIGSEQNEDHSKGGIGNYSYELEQHINAVYFENIEYDGATAQYHFE